VISRLPSPEDAVRLWSYVTGLASFPGFAELKRSLRERPRLRSFGVEPGTAGVEEDWHGHTRAGAPPPVTLAWGRLVTASLGNQSAPARA
jgi:hypothetical protein